MTQKKMPEIEKLMEAWSQDFEAKFSLDKLPDENIEMNL